MKTTNDPETQARSLRGGLRSFPALLLLSLSACTFIFNPPDGQPDEDEVVLLVNEEERVVTSFEETLTVTSEDALLLDMEIFSDPDELAIDDELTVFVTLEIPDHNRMPLGTPIPIGQDEDDLIIGSFDYACFCPVDSTTPSEIVGTVTFEILAPDRVKGVADMLLFGAGESGAEFEQVELLAPFDAVSRPLD